MPPINALIKPASGNCNLNCKYCFYKDVTKNREIKNYGYMSFDTLEDLIKSIFHYGEHSVGFAFQGGEPTLIGLDFYRKLVELQKRYNVKKLKVNNSLQTNGMVIDDKWAQFLSENNFLVGISLDGPKDIHDTNRVNITDSGSHARVEKTIDLFNKYKIKYNILCVVTKLVARHVEKLYNYYIKNGFCYLQFIPCLDEIGAEPGENPYSLTPEIYKDFLKKLFDLWYRDYIRGKKISIRMFDNILQIILGLQPESCDMRGQCSANVVVEADGSVYPCDFYVVDKWKMGNIQEQSLIEMLQSERAETFVRQSQILPQSCKNCEFLYFCRGGCKRHYESKEDIKLSNYFCLAYKEFYKYTLPRFYEIGRMMSYA